MTRLIARLLMGLVVVAAIGVGLLLLRNSQMDRGVQALKREDGAAALASLKPLAQLGDGTAQMLVGSIYAYGWGGVHKSDADAIYWFHRLGPRGPLVAEEGADPAAPYQLMVAKAYAAGADGVRADAGESVKWLKLAAEAGSKEAALALSLSRQ
ncbi:sel1 repeat family protein [Mesorhizobium sp. M1E.F.Ca.ET.045.02.1.1]|uniref:SEL1-like repeat protein n=1 Tax=unclassified Mesorhizobium TaxID=325217 RepID=UPI000F74D206|nr:MULTISPECIES: SEL1-like repeat protein [unclassified Mesorhizobium]AZO24533.1 sel1 repeat family protein [Mesorhizobium sp. M1E.F.Ca.ET.045.02.1.1]RUW33412.1 sel1 repeat family protein [Mesorhizobium sp. M1E.F.Ca.ET.041.01.1.1]RUW82277.1 sel1 repeat family protein [Mesorhizobium sp. M1E.F.Ca.ET.063.01.1.1]RWD80622.1 MAG: sel1 repeat family protein [Mesorhizobium sp.]